jgi:hypothetical protein
MTAVRRASPEFGKVSGTDAFAGYGYPEVPCRVPQFDLFGDGHVSVPEHYV